MIQNAPATLEFENVDFAKIGEDLMNIIKQIRYATNNHDGGPEIGNLTSFLRNKFLSR